MNRKIITLIALVMLVLGISLGIFLSRNNWYMPGRYVGLALGLFFIFQGAIFVKTKPMSKKAVKLRRLEVILGILVVVYGLFCFFGSAFEIIMQYRNAPIAQQYYYESKRLDSLGKTDDAIKAAQKAIKLNPELGKAHLMLGALYYDKRQCDLALCEYNQALRYLKNDTVNLALTHYGIASVYTCSECRIKCPECFKKEIGGKDPTDAAIDEYKTAITIDPNCLEAHLGLGSAYLIKGNLDLAQQEYKFLITKDKKLADELKADIDRFMKKK